MAFSKIPRTQQPVVAALLDGVVVAGSYEFDGGTRGGATTRLSAWCPFFPKRSLGPLAGRALFALRDKGLVRAVAPRGIDGHDYDLVPGAVVDDRADAVRRNRFVPPARRALR